MTADTYELFASWGNRPETDEGGARRCADMLTRLAGIDPTFAQWRKKANSREAAEDPFCEMPPSLGELTDIFNRSRHYRYQPPAVWLELGFTFGAWNGVDQPFSSSLLVSVGRYGSRANLANSIKLSIPELRLANDCSWSGGELRSIVLAIAEPWEARTVFIRSDRYQRLALTANPDPRARRPWAGWLNYIAPPDSFRVTPPDGVVAERLANGGLLATLCDEPFDVENPRHLALADAMQQALRPIQD